MNVEDRRRMAREGFEDVLTAVTTVEVTEGIAFQYRKNLVEALTKGPINDKDVVACALRAAGFEAEVTL